MNEALIQVIRSLALVWRQDFVAASAALRAPKRCTAPPPPAAVLVAGTAAFWGLTVPSCEAADDPPSNADLASHHAGRDGEHEHMEQSMRTFSSRTGSVEFFRGKKNKRQCTSCGEGG